VWPDALAMAKRYAATRSTASASSASDGFGLTAREREVLREIATGRTNKEIALTLGMRPKTVMHHCASIYRKLGVKTRSEATATALRSGLLDG
jgi:DNA-binding CsgD family transcriptional regulator